MKRLAIATFTITPFTLLAEEGGTGHYQPGSMSSFMDGVAPEETFLLRYNFLSWQADASANRTIPMAGLLTAGAEVDSVAHGLTMFWRPSWGSINKDWSFAMSATVPWVDLEVSADVISFEGTARRSDKIEGIGDIVLIPFMLNQKISDDFSINYRVGAYAPTGDFEAGRLANTGKNYWTIEPTVGFMYFGQKNGREASLFVGADFNFENPDTDYHTGTQLHLDGTLAQHFPLCNGIAGVGVSGYWYEQVSGDSGDGAILGDFEARTIGIGPALSFVRQCDDTEFLAELKWVHEVETKNRPSGDFIWFKFAAKF